MNKALMQCDCCDYYSMPSGSDYEICAVCFWEQDIFGIEQPDTRSGANHGLTLRQGRRNFKEFHACAKQFIENVVSDQDRQQYRLSVHSLDELNVFTVDCAHIESEEEFWRAYLATTHPEGAGFFGRNLDAFRDALSGGPGWPGACVIYFINTERIQPLRSGYFYEALLEIAHESNEVSVYVE
jgi:RNAse (barnase) inhibitor barstar